MRVIGTAGHVDHGKSTLIEKLSGMNPDRLQEEQARSMTIDLGFAWLQLPSQQTIGIVDVPGHRDFIENMLAGVGGIDAALLVIAADEGIMPQTREHLAILKLLQVDSLIAVLTKTDLVDDPDWLELVSLEVADLLAQHQLDAAPIVPVSAHSGAGLDALLAAMQRLLEGLPPRPDHAQPRLPIDRVFVVSGFGTVVTGTLAGGTLTVGDSIELQPSGKSGRVRGLQSYQQPVPSAAPGSRVAVNIAGISSSEIQRGDVLTHPGQLRPTRLADAHFSQLPDVEHLLEHNAQVKLFCGAAESIANVRLLDSDMLAPGSTGWLQIRLRDPLPLTRGDRFILRCPSPPQTIGGGLILNAHPKRRLKRFQPALIRELELHLSGTPAEQTALAARGPAPVHRTELQQTLGWPTGDLTAALTAALDAGLLIQIDSERCWAAESYQHAVQRLRTALQIYHQDHPLRLGMRRPELRSRLKIKLSLLDVLIERDAQVCSDPHWVRLREHRIRFSPEQQAKADALLQILAAQPYTPPSIAELNQIAGEPIVRALLDLRQLINVSDQIAFSQASYSQLVAAIRAHIQEFGEIDAKTLRDQFGTSRKYAIAVLEHLDSLGITQRIGDVRKGGRHLHPTS